MTATFKFDSVVDRQLAVNSTPDLLLNEQRNVSRMATASGTIALDTSYPTGGYPASPAKFGLTNINGVLFGHPPGYLVAYNSATDKVQVFDEGTAAGGFVEVANATNLSALQAVYFEAKGTA